MVGSNQSTQVKAYTKVNDLNYPDYTTLADQMTQGELLASPAEIHGLFVGLLAGGMRHDDKSWQLHLNELFNDNMALPVSLNRELGSLMATTHTALSDGQFSFQPLLPDDDAPLDERAEAMAQWVQNFVIGFALVCQELNKAPQDIQEIMSDFNSISQMSTEFDSAGEEDEQAYFEVLEYLRIGAMACYNHFSLIMQQDTPTLH